MLLFLITPCGFTKLNGAASFLPTTVSPGKFLLLKRERMWEWDLA
jgi:hypothetical protein